MDTYMDMYMRMYIDMDMDMNLCNYIHMYIDMYTDMHMDMLHGHAYVCASRAFPSNARHVHGHVLHNVASACV